MVRGKISLARGIQICSNSFFFILSDHRPYIAKGFMYLFIYLSMFHYLCNTTCNDYIQYTYYTLYTYVLSFVCLPYLHYSSCTLYAYVLMSC